MQSRLSPHPVQPTTTSTPILHIALGYRDVLPLLLIPTHLKPLPPLVQSPISHLQ